MRTGRHPTARTRVAALTAGALLLLASCGGARNSLGTAASACFRAVPPARDAVARKGKLVGVRKIDTDAFQKRFPNDQKLAAVKSKDLCVFAFHGTYRAGDVPLATGKQAGTYAIVAVTIQHPVVVAAFVLDRLPTRFAHLK